MTAASSTELIAAAERWWEILKHKKFQKRSFTNGYIMGAVLGVNNENLKMARNPIDPEPAVRRYAWNACRSERESVVGSDDWPAGEAGTYQGFFNCGWDAAIAYMKAQK